ncbi:hypothetical protein [Natrialbaceae archaeon AArc-T1-2]|uniref:hypothetical protein n=1 Tax=Natrialbaceae archaeon AArc-T1-2 TaxID=3053904 RepID=UPI00255B2AAD|nr:hypothetical protein [Natrialbaceae archaeon AArc-T1-2]WIV68858.1 hypothetical protein QQ977_16280 [Natrialbaceae archaeon AArc-T1-2]
MSNPIESGSGSRLESLCLEHEGTSWPAFVTDVLLLVAFGASTVGVFAGILGLVAGATVVAVRRLVGTPYALAVGHLWLVGLFPNAIDPVSFLIVETAFVAVLLAPATRARSPVRFAAMTAAAVLTFAGVAWLTLEYAAQPLWLVAMTLAGAVALASYALHRYELVVLGLVDEDGPDHEPVSSRSTDSTPPTDTTDAAAPDDT